MIAFTSIARPVFISRSRSCSSHLNPGRLFTPTRISALVLCFAFSAVYSTSSYSAEHPHRNHGASPPVLLTAPGNDAFAAIQEVVHKLQADPKTDWSRVDLEGLRQHLVDMENTTLHVDVVEQKPIAGGVTFTVKPVTPRAAASLDRTLGAHPEILKQETGWNFRALKKRDAWTVDVTSSKADEAAKIQGLGYIGIMALGNHHQPHHWQMAIGSNPHHAH